MYVILSGGKGTQEKCFVCSIPTLPHTLHPPAEPGCAQEGICQQGKVGQRRGGMHVASFQSPKLEPRRCLQIQETFF